MTIRLPWMRPDAPYMPIATMGLLANVADSTAHWHDGVLTINTDHDIEELAELLLAAPLPDVEAIPWPARAGQSLASALSTYADPLAGYATLCSLVLGTLQERMLRAIATDQARRSPSGAPARSRLLAGAKADISPFRWHPKATAESLAHELTVGPTFTGNDSGPGMGLVPETHTFGGSVGRTASTIGTASTMLSLLIRHGLLALPPVGGPGHGPHRAGGPLLDRDRDLSWPVWNVPVDRAGLAALYVWSAVHEASPDPGVLTPRGVHAVYRSTPVSLSDTVSVYRWGRRVT